MSGAAATVTGLGWARAAFGADAQPDLVVLNARVYTVDDRMPKAQAFTVIGGRRSGILSAARRWL